MTEHAHDLFVHDPSAWGAWPLPGAPLPSPDVTRLLRCEGSLTQALREHSGDRFSLTVERQANCDFTGLQIGPLEAGFGTVREVILCGDAVPWVFAQTLIPDATVKAQRWITELGGQPLGDALFHREDVVRSPLSFACIAPGQPLHRRITELGRAKAHDVLFARRSCFFANDAPLLITEVFLPALCPIR